jgi:anti-sigma B factor antagonist
MNMLDGMEELVLDDGALEGALLEGALIDSLPSKDQVSTLILEGELLDEELSRVGQELFRLASRGFRYVVLDLTDVSHLDYRGVRPFVARAELFRQAGGDVKVSGASPYLQAIFRAAGAYQAFEFHPDMHKAREAFERQLQPRWG